MIVAPTPDPEKLLVKLKSAIDSKKIKTWSYDSEGDFTHTADQWRQLAWLTPQIADGAIIFSIIPPRDKHITKLIYAIYHGRFIEMLLRHFDEDLSGNAEVTPLPQGDDIIE